MRALIFIFIFTHQQAALAGVISNLVMARNQQDLRQIRNSFELETETQSACRLQLAQHAIPDNCFKWLELEYKNKKLSAGEYKTRKDHLTLLCQRWVGREGLVLSVIDLPSLPASCKEAVTLRLQREIYKQGDNVGLIFEDLSKSELDPLSGNSTLSNSEATR